MNNYLSQAEYPVGSPLTGQGPLGNPLNAEYTFVGILTTIIGLMTIIAGIWFIFLLIIGGISWMTSGGDKGKLASARSQMLSGAIGLTIVVAALFLAEVFGGLIGLGNILDLGGMFSQIVPP